jgi:hypothetical protein
MGRLDEMKSIVVLFSAVLLACIAAQAAPVIINTSGPAPLDLSPENMNIVSTEHTAEYLAKTGLGDTGGVAAFNASGGWTIDLRTTDNKPVGRMNLRLFQVGNLVFGTGSLDTFSNSAQTITAYGTTSEGNSISLAVVSLEAVDLYRMVINNANSNDISGSFSAYSSKGAVLTGILTGTREISRQIS